MLSATDIEERYHWRKEDHEEIWWSNTQKHLWLFYFLATLFGPDKLIVELGTYTGACSTVAWAAAVNDTGGSLVTVDVKDRGQEERLCEEENVSVIVGDDIVLGRVWETPIDLLYIDDGHAPEHVEEEIEAWAQHVKVGGLVLFHDTCPGKGPWLAFQELVSWEGWEIAFKMPHTWNDGLFAARRTA